MRLMRIDLGKFKSVACLYGGEDEVTFRTIETRPQAVHDLLVAWAPLDRSGRRAALRSYGGVNWYRN